MLNKTLENSSQQRQFGSMMKSWLNDVSQYGCWCYFGSMAPGYGRGKPVDELDQYCKDLHQGYECAVLDSENEGDFSCVSHDMTYNLVTSLEKTDEEIYLECLGANGGVENCAVRTCATETRFVKYVADYANVKDPNMVAYHVSEGNFDYNKDCPSVPGVASNRQCCGDWSVRRFPYRALNGERSCCGQSLYSTNQF